MSEAMNIIIAGSRDFDDYRLLKKTVSDYIEENQVNNTQQIRVISGGAKGADRLFTIPAAIIIYIAFFIVFLVTFIYTLGIKEEKK